MTQLILGGIPVTLESGAPAVSYGVEGGSTDLRLSGGKPVRMRHWKSRVITISGTGWISSGLEGLDLDEEQLLKCHAPLRIASVSSSLTLTATPRDDSPVTAEALVNDRWVKTPVSVVDLAATITEIAGAQAYAVTLFPQFTVLCVPLDEDYGDSVVGWQLVCHEVPND